MKSKKKIQDIIGCGLRIKEWRKSLGIKSFELAKKIKVSQGSLSDIENNKSNPSAPTILNLLKYTNINIHWMLTGKNGDIGEGELPKEKVPFVINLNPSVNEVLVRYQK